MYFIFVCSQTFHFLFTLLRWLTYIVWHVCRRTKPSELTRWSLVSGATGADAEAGGEGDVDTAEVVGPRFDSCLSTHAHDARYFTVYTGKQNAKAVKPNYIYCAATLYQTPTQKNNRSNCFAKLTP